MGQNPIYRNQRLQSKLAEMDADVTAITDGSTVRTGAVKNSDNAGTVGAATVTAVEYGDGTNHVTVLTLASFIVGAPEASANKAFGNKIYSFPEGVHLHEVSYFTLGLTQTGVTSDKPDIGVGSVKGTGSIAVLNDGTMEDYITGQTWAVALDGTAQIVGPVGAKAGILTGISLSTAASVKDVFLNAADGWHASVTGNLVASGTIVLIWKTMV